MRWSRSRKSGLRPGASHATDGRRTLRRMHRSLYLFNAFWFILNMAVAFTTR